MKFLIVCILFGLSFACNFLPNVEYLCLPCGGDYSCTSTGACDTDTVPGCNLPNNAEFWVCCTAANCDVKGPGVCFYEDYVSPSTTPSQIPANHGGNQDGSTGCGTGCFIVIGVLLFSFICCILIMVVLGLIFIRNRKTSEKHNIDYVNSQTYT